MMPFYSLLILKAIILYPEARPPYVAAGIQPALFPSKTYFLNTIFMFSQFVVFVSRSRPDPALLPPAEGGTAQQMLRLMRHQFRISFNIKPTVSSTTICFTGKEIVFVSDSEIFM